MGELPPFSCYCYISLSPLTMTLFKVPHGGEKEVRVEFEKTKDKEVSW